MKQLATLTSALYRLAAAKGKKHWLLGAGVFAGLIGVSLWSDATPVARDLNVRLSQVFVNLTHFETTPSKITTVGLDDQFFYRLNHGHSPMAPTLLANVVDGLVEAGVAVVVLDLDFSDPFPAGTEVDPAYAAELDGLKTSICAAAARVPVVLSATMNKDGRSIRRSLLQELPCPGANVTYGFVNLTPDRRYVPLAMYDEPNLRVVLSMPVAIARATPGRGRKDPAVERTLLSDVTDTPPMAPFLESRSIPNYSAATLLSNGAAAARPDLLGQVGMVVGSWHERTQETGALVDLHESPLGPQAGGQMLAVKAESLMTRRLYRPMSPGLLMTGKILELGVLTFILGCIDVGWIKVSLVVIALGFNLFLGWLLTNFGVMADAVLPLAMLIVHPLADQILEWYEISHNWRTNHVQT